MSPWNVWPRKQTQKPARHISVFVFPAHSSPHSYSCHNSRQCCCTVIWAPQPASCIVNGNSKICAWCHLSPQQPRSSVTATGSSRCPQGPVKGFLFCHFIGNGKAISYTSNIWHTWIWISTHTSKSMAKGFSQILKVVQHTYTLHTGVMTGICNIWAMFRENTRKCLEDYIFLTFLKDYIR